MPDLALGLTVYLSFSDDALTAINRIAAALERLASPPSPAVAFAPAQPVAPGVSAPDSVQPALEPPEGPSRAGGETATGRPEQTPRLFPKQWFTPARKQRLIELYPTAMSMKDIHAEIARMDGPPIGSRQQLRALANKITPRISRPPEFMPSGIRQRPTAPVPPVSGAPADTALAQAFSRANVEPEVAPTPPAPARPLAPALTRVEALQRVSAISASKHAATPPRGEPIVAGQEAIRTWAAARGLHMQAFDLAAVNAKAAALGLPGFILKTRHS